MSSTFFRVLLRVQADWFKVANKKRKCYDARMDEGRKRVLLIAASILAARKLAQFDAGRRVPATVSAIGDAVRWAEEIMRAIDARFPEGKQTGGSK